MMFKYSVDGKAKGMICLVTGKRHLICQDIGSAVESLGEYFVECYACYAPML